MRAEGEGDSACTDTSEIESESQGVRARVSVGVMSSACVCLQARPLQQFLVSRPGLTRLVGFAVLRYFTADVWTAYLNQDNTSMPGEPISKTRTPGCQLI